MSIRCRLALILALALPVPLALSVALPAAASQMMDRGDFENAARAAAPMAGSSYPWVRCAALYRAMRRHAGPAELGRDRWDEARRIDALLTRGAALARAEEYGQPWQSAKIQAEVDVDAVARLYLRRFEAAILETGRPWTRDPLWQSDNAECGGLLDDL